MNIEKELKKNGITVIDKLDTLSINTLAKTLLKNCVGHSLTNVL